MYKLEVLRTPGRPLAGSPRGAPRVCNLSHGKKKQMKSYYRRVHVKGPRIGAKRKVSKVLLMQGSQDGPDGKTQPPGSEFPAQVVRMNA